MSRRSLGEGWSQHAFLVSNVNLQRAGTARSTQLPKT